VPTISVFTCANLSIYGDAIDAVLTDTDRAATRTIVAGLENMRIYSPTMMDTCMFRLR
jgi:hypothetical protein